MLLSRPISPFLASRANFRCAVLWTRPAAWMFVLVFAASNGIAQQPWHRHTIDDTLRGADGVRLADFNGDNLPDIVTGWEESGLVRIYLHPGFGSKAAADRLLVESPWPAVTIGPAPSVEDAVWFDINRDGRLDVLACCEGKEQRLRVFLAPTDQTAALDSGAWKAIDVVASIGRSRWMYAAPRTTTLETSTKPGQMSLHQVFLGSKDPVGQVALLEVNDSQSQLLANVRLQKLAAASWIMSLVQHDVDYDGDLDLVYSDRKGDRSGVYWLEADGSSFQRHLIGGLGEEVMFLTIAPSSQTATTPAKPTVFVGAKPNRIIRLTCGEDPRSLWQTEDVWSADPLKYGRAKAVAAGQISGEGSFDLIYTCESADPPLQGVVLLTKDSNGAWSSCGISGPEGIKFDDAKLVDLDRDGDLDVLTCEERHQSKGLGVIWYENPHR